MVKLSNISTKEAIADIEANYIDALKEYLPYNRMFWDIKLPEGIKKGLVKLQNDRNLPTVAEEKEGFPFNYITLDGDQISYVPYKGYWKKVDVLDQIYLLIQTKNTEVKPWLNSPTAPPINPYTDYPAVTIKPGKFAKKMFPGATPQDCEAFNHAVMEYLSSFGTDAITVTADVVHWYSGRQYYKGGKRNLGSSCMRYDHCEEFIQWYEKNDVEMAIFKHPDDPETISSRALLWSDVTIVAGPDELVGRTITLMDRIYANTDEDEARMKAWAKQQGFYRKTKQNYEDKMVITTPEGDEVVLTLSFTIRDNNHAMGPHPYMDTFTYMMEIDGQITMTNNPDWAKGGRSFTILESTSGNCEGSERWLGEGCEEEDDE